MTRNQKAILAVVIVPVEVALAVLAWRDLANRPERQIRGKKNLWRVAMLLNPGNSVLYWLFGRR